MRLFSQLINKSLSALVSVAMVVTTFPLAVPTVAAAPLCSSAYAADSGQDAACAAVRIGGQTVTYPKLQWERVSGMPLAQTTNGLHVTGGSEAVQLANRSAAALGLTAADVASVVTMFPANVPYIFARYDDKHGGTLRIDIFKLEKTISGGQQQAGLYHAVFTPSNGDVWKTSRSYISPDAYAGGTTPGLNPFTAFQQGTDDMFHNINLAGAQVAIGHAMRFAGAPIAVLEVAQTSIIPETHTSGGWFRKTTTTTYKGHAKPTWFIAQPKAFMQRSTNMQETGYCVTDPTASSCPWYAVARPGVAFEQFDGGMLSNFDDVWVVGQESQSGWGFLAVLVVAVVASFALAAIAPALMSAAGVGGAAAGSAGTAAIGGAAVSSATATGMFGSLLVNAGLIETGVALSTSIAIETAAYAAGLSLISGANMSSVLTMGPGVVAASVGVANATMGNTQMDKYNEALDSQHVLPSVTGDFSKGAPTLTGFTQTVVGSCAPGASLSQCVGATGIIQHVDQYNEQNMVDFVRDNSGVIVRDARGSAGNIGP